MADTKKLDDLIKNNKLTKTEVARRLGLSRYGFYKKLNNETEFKLSEVSQLSEMLGIKTPKEREAIFFNWGVEYKSTMTGSKYLKLVRQKQIELDVSDKELRRIVGWSESTMRRRYKTPDAITLGEAYKINQYLQIK